VSATPDDAAPDDAPPYLVPHSREALRIIYRDDALLLVRKPDLLLSVPGRHPLNRDCMIARLQCDFPDALIVHRLDLDTSGILVLARSKAAQSALSRLFQERAVDKCYEAVVAGCVRDETGSIDLPIARDWERRPLQKICRDSGKAALTHFRVLARGPDWTRLRLQPVTGRSHQLRIHCREVGHPILGCDMYAPNEILGRAPRLMLHATRIAFAHPRSGRRLVGHSHAPF
jgi:tRNA pseudouridine32 synthase/23S rRNA pseudouridine746 synthase